MLWCIDRIYIGLHINACRRNADQYECDKRSSRLALSKYNECFASQEKLCILLHASNIAKRMENYAKEQRATLNMPSVTVSCTSSNTIINIIFDHSTSKAKQLHRTTNIRKPQRFLDTGKWYANISYRRFLFFFLPLCH